MQHTKIKLLLAIQLIILLNTSLLGQSSTGGYPGSYLTMGIGSRAASMGDAFTGLANDATASFWNPGGLAQVRSAQIFGMYTLLSLDRRYNYLSIAQPLGKTTIGLSWINYQVGNIIGRDELGNQTGQISNSQNVFQLSFGFPIKKWFLSGGTIKYLHNSLAENLAEGFGYDFGFLIKFSRHISFGVSHQNFNSELHWDTSSNLRETLPYLTRVGIAFRLKSIPVTLTGDYVNYEISDPSYHFGCEIDLIDNFGVRSGFNNGKFNIGGYIAVPIDGSNIQFDYGFCNSNIDQTSIHRLSILLSFSKRQDKRQTVTRNFQSIQQKEMRIRKVVKNIYGLISTTNDSNIQQGMLLNLFRTINKQKKLIGNVKVIEIRSTGTAIQIMNIKKGYKVEVGDIVIIE